VGDILLKDQHKGELPAARRDKQTVKEYERNDRPFRAIQLTAGTPGACAAWLLTVRPVGARSAIAAGGGAIARTLTPALSRSTGRGGNSRENLMFSKMIRRVVVLLALGIVVTEGGAAENLGLRLAWKENILTISGEKLPGREMKVWYIEAYCRPGSTNRRWEQTVIGHRTRLVSAGEDGKSLVLECELKDGVKVRHEIAAGVDEVEFRLTANNPTDKASEAHWAQPCVRVGAFAGRDQKTYLEKCFIFLDGKLSRMPTRDWATAAIYTPGQVWCPRHVDRGDVNPRPLSRAVPDNGLIGCFSADEKMMMAVAFEPYQELFQGVITCIHSDFRIGGLAAGETKRIRGKIYFLKADEKGLLERYRRDFGR
jgi:hypothetical protein